MAKEYIPPHDIIVVNDGSDDDTESVVRGSGCTLLSHTTNKGKGAALRTGFDFVNSRKYDIVITMDADLQHLPKDIPRFVEEYSVHHQDVIVGNRLGGKKNMPLLRVMSNTITTFLVKARTGALIEDSQSGFRCIASGVLRKIRITTDGFEAETEFLIKAAANGCSFGSIPIETIYAGEKSSMTHLTTTLNFIKVLFKQYFSKVCFGENRLMIKNEFGDIVYISKYNDIY